MAVKAIKKPGLHAVGKNLYLQVGKTGSRSWVMKYMHNGRSREMGLGSYDVVDLKVAREKVIDAKRLIDRDIDPIDHQNQKAAEAEAEVKRGQSFQEVAEAYMAIHVPQHSNAKHRKQWPSTLKRYVYPVMGQKAISEIDQDDIKKVLQPIWNTKTETASRVRGRMEKILDYAAYSKMRDGDNPARWKGAMAHEFAPKEKVSPVKHQRSLHYKEVPEFWVRLLQEPNLSARCLEFLILTATRSNEVRLATWDEIELEVRIWRIPKERMKAGRGHNVPLSTSAVKLLEQLKPYTDGGLIFPGIKPGKPLSENTKVQLLKRMGVDSTAHGFRASFRTWAADRTNYPFAVMEAALAHITGSATVQAYQRGDHLEKRRALMQEWDDHLCTELAKQPAGSEG